MNTINITKCPFCGSDNFEHMDENYYWNGRPWHCHDCDSWFNEDDCQHQLYWEKISCFLNGTSEQKPLTLSKGIYLSTKNKNCIKKIFQQEGEGTMWYQFSQNPIWHDMYKLSTKNLKAILYSIQQNIRQNLKKTIILKLEKIIQKLS